MSTATSPGVGRQDQNKDPIGFAGGDTNVYAYVGNDPVNFVDHSGTDRAAAVALGAALGADIGFTVGGGTGLVAGIASGGVPAIGLTPAAAIGGAGIGAGVGAVVGGAAYDVVETVGDWVDGLLYARKADLREVDEIARRLGLDRDVASERLHRIEKGLRGRKVVLESDGTVRDPVSGEEIGNICDE